MNAITNSIKQLLTSSFALPWIDTHPDREHPDVLVMFLDGGTNYLYQITQWFQTLERLDKKLNIAVVIASKDAASLVEQQKGFRVITLSKRSLLPDFLRAAKPKVLLYVNKNLVGYQSLRYNHGIHAFIGHGESDKAYMTQNTIKFFDFYLAAGPAAFERMARDVSFYDTEKKMREIGKAQIDDEYQTPQDFVRNGKPVILYAPTWEGVTKQTRYSSVLSHGKEIVKKIIDSEKYQLIYRPHPMVGSRMPEFQKANDEIISLLAKSNQKNGTRHRFDVGSFGWQLNESDLMITDVSAVAYEWLSTGKPLIMTKPTEVLAEVDKSGLISQLPLLSKKKLVNFETILEDALQDSSTREMFTKWRNFYFGDIPKGENTNRLVSTISALLTAGNSLQELHEHIHYETKPPRGAPLGLLRYVNFAIKETLGRVLLAKSSKVELKELLGTEVLISNSDPFDARPVIDKLELLLEDPEKKYLLLTNQSTTYLAVVARFKIKDKSRAKNLTVLMSSDAASYEKHLVSLKPKSVLYLKHHMLNHLSLRRNGIKHILLWPELDQNFSLDRTVTFYDEVITKDSELKQRISENIFYPGESNVTLEKN